MILLVLALPLFGSVVLALWPRNADLSPRIFATVIAGATLVAAVYLLPGLDDAGTDDGTVLDPRHEVDLPWLGVIDVRLHVGADGISVPLILLTALLTLLCMVHNWVERPDRPALFCSLVLLLEVGALGTFVALDLVLFFAAFEAVLIPMYFLISRWGGPGGGAAALKFAVYTLTGSAALLVGLVFIYASTGTFDLVELSERGGAGISTAVQVAAFGALFVGFAVKSPLWPLHTWLPPAHTEAPTVGSVLLAGVQLKMGTYGLVRIALPVLPEGARALAPILAALAVTGILVAAWACYTQNDLKRLIAYSSVGHMGFVLLGISTLTAAGINAALLANVAHGLITGLLFFLVGAVKSRFHTGQLDELGSGLWGRLPRLGFALTFACVASLGLPGLAGFWGEAMAVFAALRPADGLPATLFTVLAVLAAVGAAMTAVYFLRLLQRLVVGPVTAPSAGPAEALSSQGLIQLRHGLRAVDVWATERVVHLPLLTLTLALGLYPAVVLSLTEGPVAALVDAVMVAGA
ncbi:MAG: NADH-quinone oxidoreductase subunit M [Actinomycetota bacterium]|nr:NADH-quinone oxidoreductase subunit M [Actinomycetota bacterium]